MGFVDDFLASRDRSQERAWPVGKGSIMGMDSSWGHDDSLYSPEEYGDWLVTSNEIFSASMLRARMMSSLRLNLYQGSDSTKKAMPDHPAAQLLGYVNKHWTARRLARMDELSMCLWGESYWAIETDGGKPKEIWWCKPSRMRPVPDEENYLVGYIYEPIHGGQRIHFNADEVIWFRYPNPLDEFSALSPVAAAKLAAEAASAMMTSNRNMFRNGLQVAGLITPPAEMKTFTPQQADDLELFLRKKLSGSEQAHRWAVMRYEANWKPMAINPKDAEFTSGLGLTLRQVANAYGIPVPLLNDMSGATLANVSELTKAFWAHTLVPDSQLHAEEIVEQFLPRYGKGSPDYAEYDYSAVPALQESATEVWSRDTQALDRGMITINEWRLRNGMPAENWGERPWLPLNKAQVDENGKLEMPAPQGMPGAPGVAGGMPGEMPQDGMQGGPVPVGPGGVPLPTLPDDEVNPANQPARSQFSPLALDHMQARELLAAFVRTNGRVPAARGN